MSLVAPYISVILPNYNHGEYITKALEALYLQSDFIVEIIVIDDRSTDDSWDIISRQAKANNLVRPFRNDVNIGAIGALNFGLSVATGSHVYMAAADDWVLPGFFRRACEALQSNPACGIVCGEAELRDGVTGRNIGYRPPVAPVSGKGALRPEDVQALLRRTDNFILTGSSVFRRDAAMAFGALNPDLRSFADGILLRKIALSSGIFYFNTPMAVWNFFPSGYSGNTARDADLAMEALKIIPEAIEADPVFPGWYAPLFRKRWRFAVARILLENYPENRDAIIKIAAPSGLDRVALETVMTCFRGSIGRYAILGWLTLRLRPYRIGDLLITMARRRWRNRNPQRL